MQRRNFIRICIAGATTCSTPMAVAAPATEPPVGRRYNRVKLVNGSGEAIIARSLKTNFNYVFNYPYSSTPCFLLNLDQPIPGPVSLKTAAGIAYEWAGGVGRGKTIVAYSAICAHKLAYPTKQVSFIGFRANPGAANSRGKTITCCADKSVYDPFAGARVMSGPAPQPLAAILLEHDAVSDALVAVGTFGGEKFNEFFQKYEFQLSMEMGGVGSAKQIVTGTTRLYDMANYSAQTAQC